MRKPAAANIKELPVIGHFVKRPGRKNTLKLTRSEVVGKYLKKQIARGDYNFSKYLYSEAIKDYLTVYFIDPTNREVLEKLRKIPFSHTKQPSCKEGCFFYLVKPGEDLRSIAKKLYGNDSRYKLLADANALHAPYTVYQRQLLVTPYAYGLVRSSAYKLRRAGKECFDAGNFGCAVDRFSFYLAMSTGDVEARKLFKDSLYKKILSQYENKNYREAVEYTKYLKRAGSEYKIAIDDIVSKLRKLELRREDSVLNKLLVQGDSLRSMGDLLGAEKRYKEALSVVGDVDIKKEIHVLLERINALKPVITILEESERLSSAGDFDSAIKRYKRALKNTDNVETRRYIAALMNRTAKKQTVNVLLADGKALENGGFFERATEKYLEAFKLTNTPELRKNILSLVLGMDMLKLRKKASMVKENAVKAYYSGDYEDAYEKIIKAKKLHPKNSNILSWYKKISDVLQNVIVAEKLLFDKPVKAMSRYCDIISNHGMTPRLEKAIISLVPKISDMANSPAVFKKIDGCSELLDYVKALQ